MKSFSLDDLRCDLEKALPDFLCDRGKIESALRLAYEAHAGQFRTARDRAKERIPYIVHPVGVAKIVVSLWKNGDLPDELETLVCAALTHDVLEDSSIDYETLESRTSTRCAELVLQLTKPQVCSETARSDRNIIFAEQIRAAGASAVFLKSCDALHNLARPQSVPTGLLEKTIAKVEGTYLPLLKGMPFEERIKKEFARLLLAAKESLATRSELTLQQELGSCDEFIQTCLNAANQKTLEIHDIASFLSRFKGILECFHGDPATVINAATPAGCNPPLSSELEALLPEGELSLLEPLPLSKSPVGCALRVVSIAFLTQQAIEEQTFPLVLFLDGSPNAQKFTFPLLKAGITILAQKFNEARTKALLNLSSHLQHINLKLTAEQATSFRLTYRQINDIALLIDASTYVLNNLERTIRQCLKEGHSNQSPERFESRVKAPLSILRKLKERNLLSAEDIDDVVGVRLVFISASSRDKFATELAEHLARNRPDLYFSVNHGSFHSETISSSLGYRATHLRFTVPSPVIDAKEIGCEVQLRTLHEDTWARVSEAFIYKRSAVPQNRRKDLLKKLSEIRDRADVLIQSSTQS